MSKFLRPLALMIAAALSVGTAHATVRLKDIADFEGARENMLVGYGLVVGLNGTGDDLTRDIFTRESLIGMLERLGVNARDPQLRTKNVAAVMVTGTLRADARQGSRIDITVSAVGDAANLQGGTLVVTPLLGADGEVYAVAQGGVSVAGYSARGQGTTVTKGVPTAGRIPNGAIVERELAFDPRSLQTMNIALRNPDFTTAQRIAQAINAALRQPVARAVDGGTVRVALSDTARTDLVAFVTSIEQLRIEPDQVARVIVDEANGIIVMGENVRISTVAVAQGNLTVRITETPQVSQPNAFAPGGTPGAPGAQTVVVPRTDIKVDEQNNRRLAVVPPGVTIQELVNSLNALGIGPRDMISILQAIKAAGAMQADLEVR
ncbi:MAG TPA: flagellar basal body P-ring protein FlgI [Aliidongia sp.]|nr:flagellar basal body P-ring protein FlgI [Aliidongia sp.]